MGLKRVSLRAILVGAVLLAQFACAASLVTSSPAYVVGDVVSVEAGGSSGVPYVWSLKDWRKAIVCSGTSSESRLELGRLGVGYYYLTITDTNRVVRQTTFPVVPSPEKTRRGADEFFGVDAAFSTVCGPKRYPCPWNGGDSWATCAELLRKSGVSHVRERFKWSWANPQPGVWDFSLFRKNALLLKSKGLVVCDVVHDVPGYVERRGGFPADMGVAHEFGRKFAEAMGDCVDALEIWNEEDAYADPVWEYAPVLRSIFHGVRSVCPAMRISHGSFAYGITTGYAEALAANGLALASDVLNLHTYISPERYAEMLGGARDFLGRHDMSDRPIWFTEMNPSVEGLTKARSKAYPGFGVHSPEQEDLMARMYPKSQIVLQMQGVARSYYFVFGIYHEQGGRKDWGMIRADDYTVKPVYSAMAQTTSRLSGLRPVGRVEVEAPGVTAYLYADPSGLQTLVYWADVENEFSIPVEDDTVESTDLMGCGRPVVVANGKVRLKAEDAPAYLTGRIGPLKVVVPAIKSGLACRAAAPRNEDPSMVVRVVADSDAFKVGAKSSVCELWKESGELTFEIWNFGDKAKRCRLLLSGGTFTDVPDPFDLEPGACRTVKTMFTPDPNQGERVSLLVGGVADGRRIPPIMMDVRVQAKFMANLRPVGFDLNADSVKLNDSASSHRLNAKDGELVFHYKWDNPTSDRWTYPHFAIKGGMPKDAAYLEFEIRSSQNKPENDFRSNGGFFLRADGSRIGSMTLDFRYEPPAVGWEVRRIEIPEALRPKSDGEVVALALGGNPQGTELELGVRNIRFLCPIKKTTGPDRTEETTKDLLPVIDLTSETNRQTVIAQGTTSAYQGHPTTLLADDGRTMFCVWTIDHGGQCGPMAKSTDGGKTWTRIDQLLPDNYRYHANCPTLQKVPRPDGGVNYCVFSSNDQPGGGGGMGILMSEDEGRSWSLMPPATHLSSGMPPTGFLPLRDGSCALFGQVFKSKDAAKDRPTDDQAIWMSVTRDGGKTWSSSRIIAAADQKNICEPFAVRSPDGREIAVIMRENRHESYSMVTFSSDEGQTWSEPIDTCWGLTGDRHEGIVLPDKRLLVAFRDRAKGSSTYGQYVAWVGTWDDLKTGGPGQYRIHLARSHTGAQYGGWVGDTGYSGVELLPDGTIVCTTYCKINRDRRLQSVVSTRFKIEEIDKVFAAVPNWRPRERWRGVNLIGLFNERGKESVSGFPDANNGFHEADFKMLSEWGFNFVRFPMDYRNWCKGGDWFELDEDAMREIDKGIALGRKYGLHVQLCFHRAPGYCILGWKKEPTRLQEDEIAQKAFCWQWAQFARRYKDIPNDELTFNLLNEPSGFTDEQYKKVFGAAIKAVHEEDPKRFIMLDGTNVGLEPVPAFFDEPLVGQAMRGYAPGGISHYNAHWALRPKTEPVWPLTVESPTMPWLYGRGREDARAFVVDNAPAGTWTWDFSPADMDVTVDFIADGTTVATHAYAKEVHETFAYRMERPAARLEVWVRGRGATRFGALTLQTPDGKKTVKLGGWCQDANIANRPKGDNLHQRFISWDAELPFRLAMNADHPLERRGGTTGMDALEKFNFWPWKVASDQGVFCFVGECGCFNQTPHSVMLAWMEDQLRYFKQQGWGWCLWLMRGSFGFIDSERPDVVYEEFNGHKLDRKFLELLQKY